VKPTADRVAEALAQGRSLEAAAQAAGLTPFAVRDMTRAQPDPRVAMPEMIGSLFATPAGRTVGPLRQPTGWFFGRVDQKHVAPEDTTYEGAKGQISREILSARQQSFFNDWVGELRMEAKIQDLRGQVR
jgi:hypothetical protein